MCRTLRQRRGSSLPKASRVVGDGQSLTGEVNKWPEVIHTFTKFFAASSSSSLLPVSVSLSLYMSVLPSSLPLPHCKEIGPEILLTHFAAPLLYDLQLYNCSKSAEKLPVGAGCWACVPQSLPAFPLQRESPPTAGKLYILMQTIEITSASPWC